MPKKTRKKDDSKPVIFTKVLPSSVSAFDERVREHGEAVAFAEYGIMSKELQVRYEEFLGADHPVLSECAKFEALVGPMFEQGQIASQLENIEVEILEDLIHDPDLEIGEFPSGQPREGHVRSKPLARGKKKKGAE